MVFENEYVYTEKDYGFLLFLFSACVWFFIYAPFSFNIYWHIDYSFHEEKYGEKKYIYMYFFVVYLDATQWSHSHVEEDSIKDRHGDVLNWTEHTF